MGIRALRVLTRFPPLTDPVHRPLLYGRRCPVYVLSQAAFFSKRLLTMLRFPLPKFSKAETTPAAAVKPSPSKSAEAHPLDALTGGAFSAPTSGERASRIRQWLATEPTPEQMAEVYKDLANRDKGAAKPLKEKLDEVKRSKGQEAAAAEWAEKAQALLALPKLNLADALAWQRDAAKAGAPLSKEPLAGLKVQLVERVKTIEDLQHRTQVQREAAVLIAQRIEVLSIKPWRDAQAVLETLSADVAHWQAQADELVQDANWASVDAKFPPLLEASRGQLLAVWDAFQGALALTVKAAEDSAAPLPAVPVWADELRAARGLPTSKSETQAAADGGQPVRAPKVKMEPAVLNELRAKSAAIVQDALAKLEHEVTEGHGKSTPKVAADLRQALKENIRNIDSKLEAAAHAALTAAGELEGWQRWRADQIREELVVKAEALVAKPLGGRKQQDALRNMREQWKTSDQGGTPNHALWKRFDDACNEAHKVVEAWLEKVKEQAEANKAQRQALIDEVLAWGQANQGNTDWKHHIRSLNGFVEKWREAGHLGEKAFAEIQPVWKAAMDQADAALTAARTESLARRKAMIEEAQALGAEAQLRIDAVKSLQQRWQHEAQSVPIERKQEQKLWDAFRKPIDDAFQRKTVEREKSAAALGEHDRYVLEAAKAVELATASGDAQKIHAAAKALEAAVRGQVQVAAAAAQARTAADASQAVVSAESAPVSEENQPAAQEASAQAATESIANAAGETPPAFVDADGNLSAEAAPAEFAESAQPASPPAEPAPAPKPSAKPIVAMRGDDRPGMRKAEPAAAGRGGKFGDRKDARPGSKPGGPRSSTDNKFEPYRAERPERSERFSERPAFEERGPRLGDAAFRAQREAFDAANQALKKLAMQAHGEVLTHLLTAWEKRDPAQLPAVQELGKQVTPAVRSSWVQALSAPAGKDASEALLRLEIAAELPTPAEHISARRMLQLQLLTKRNAPAPAETWGEDAAKVLAAEFDAANARRVQNALKALLKR
jgi:ATP-dependent RNA helicase SUPV3L1/SUV3